MGSIIIRSIKMLTKGWSWGKTYRRRSEMILDIDFLNKNICL